MRAWPRLILPEDFNLKRFLAPEWVFILFTFSPNDRGWPCTIQDSLGPHDATITWKYWLYARLASGSGGFFSGGFALVSGCRVAPKYRKSLDKSAIYKDFTASFGLGGGKLVGEVKHEIRSQPL